MNVVKGRKQTFDVLHREYSLTAIEHAKKYQLLEDQFVSTFGLVPIQIEDDDFLDLSEPQQQACRAFWFNPAVVSSNRNLEMARTLARVYFNAHMDRTDK